MSAQPYFRSRPQRRDRDAELERLVAAELDACEAPAPANVGWTEEISAAERDFVELVRQWLDRRPNKHQLIHLICEDVVPADGAPASTPPQLVEHETSSAIDQGQPDSSAERDSHAAP